MFPEEKKKFLSYNTKYYIWQVDPEFVNLQLSESGRRRLHERLGEWFPYTFKTKKRYDLNFFIDLDLEGYMSGMSLNCSRSPTSRGYKYFFTNEEDRLKFILKH